MRCADHRAPHWPIRGPQLEIEEKVAVADDYRILVAIDLKAGTDQLLAEAQRYGRALDATVDVVHVSEPDPGFVGYIKKRRPRPAESGRFRTAIPREGAAGRAPANAGVRCNAVTLGLIPLSQGDLNMVFCHG